jgi:Uma2 family endonuclease
MSGPERNAERWTLHEFQEMELNAPPGQRWELVGGVLWKMMTGGSLAHNEIVSNIAVALTAAVRARGLPCRVYTENAKVLGDDLSAYPDVVLRCGPREAGATAIRDPLLIVEVMSRSTGEKDRHDKADAYWRLPSLELYLIVSQTRMDVTALARGEGDWTRRRFERPEDAIALDRLGLQLSLADIYADVVEVGAGG